MEMQATLWPTSYVKTWVQEQYGVTESSWYYHQGKMPAPDVELSGWHWYSDARFGEVKVYFARRKTPKTATGGKGV